MLFQLTYVVPSSSDCFTYHHSCYNATGSHHHGMGRIVRQPAITSAVTSDDWLYMYFESLWTDYKEAGKDPVIQLLECCDKQLQNTLRAQLVVCLMLHPFMYLTVTSSQGNLFTNIICPSHVKPKSKVICMNSLHVINEIGLKKHDLIPVTLNICATNTKISISLLL